MPSISITELQHRLFRTMGIASANLEPSGKLGRQKSYGRARKNETVAEKNNKSKRSRKHSDQRPTAQSLDSLDTDDMIFTSSPHIRPLQQRLAHATTSRDGHETVQQQWSSGSVATKHQKSHQQNPDHDRKSCVDGVSSRPISTAMRDVLAIDDAEIDHFEKKLGIKKGRKSLPRAFKEDGLDVLVADLGKNICEPVAAENDKKRKQAFDDWLSAKRIKPSSLEPRNSDHGQDNEGEEEYLRSISDRGQHATTSNLSASDDESTSESDQSFAGFDTDNENDDFEPPRRRENPYVAPTIGVSIGKYVPPSRNEASISGGQDGNAQLKRQIQGQINRLVESNILSIVQAIDALYQKNPRGHVTEILTDSVMAQICKPESLPDQFFVLTGGFCAAIYKIVGSSFGSHLIRRVVEDFATLYKGADEMTSKSNAQKEALNVMSLLTQLYTFGVVSCRIIFDYMQRLQQQLSEINVEILLRVYRMAGGFLRRHDQETFKHASNDLATAISKFSQDDATTRTKFMMDMIEQLNHGRQRTKGVELGIVSDHVIRMRKRLGELKSQARRLYGLTPMGMGLDDVEGVQEQGKWWLVGASVARNCGVTDRAHKVVAARRTADGIHSEDEEDMDLVLPDFSKKARAQGLTTKAQVAIFTALMTANSHAEGYRQYLDLRLKKDEQLEIARVLVQCVGSEAQYNEYYAMVARQACANSRIRFALQDRLWKLLRSLGESLFGQEADEDEEETADGARMKDQRRASNVARFYATLVGNGSLSIRILKPLELHDMNERTAFFVECFLVSLLRACRSKVRHEEKETSKVLGVFGPARELPSLAAGLHWLMRTRLRTSSLVGASEAKSWKRLREKAQTAIEAAA